MFGLFYVMCRFRHVMAVKWRSAFNRAHWCKDTRAPVGFYLDWIVVISIKEVVKHNTLQLNIKFN